MPDYYVYVYIDPRNLREFYYGKGRGSRKNAHLADQSDSAKTKRIAAIRREGLEPIIKVVARNLSEHDALLVEKTLLWRLGAQLTNQATGHYAENFRPPDTFHKSLPGFDYQAGLYFYNVGEGRHRNWDDYRAHGFIAAGQAPRFRDAMRSFNPGDVFAAYIPKRGFVGVGRIRETAQPIRAHTINGKPLLSLPTKCQNMAENCEDDEKSEYVCSVDWIATVARDQAKFKRKSGLYTPQKVKASLENQPATVAFVADQFGVNFQELLT